MRKGILLIILVFGLTYFNAFAGEVEVSEFSVDFGEVEVGDNQVEYVEVTNVGNTQVVIEDVDIFGDWVFHVSSDCFSPLEPGDSCELDIEFEPEEAHSYQSEVTIELRNGESYFVDVYGEGVWE